MFGTVQPMRRAFRWAAASGPFQLHYRYWPVNVGQIVAAEATTAGADERQRVTRDLVHGPADQTQRYPRVR